MKRKQLYKYIREEIISELSLNEVIITVMLKKML
jgi:hypothetical protein